MEVQKESIGIVNGKGERTRVEKLCLACFSDPEAFCTT